jgi:hypothetical protein
VSVQDPVYRTIDVQARVFLKPGANAQVTRQRIEQALKEFFAISQPDGTPNPRVDFGFYIQDAEENPVAEVAWSNVLVVVEGVPGVRKIGDEEDDFLLNGSSDDVPLAHREFPVLGQVTLVNGDTGGLL